MRTQFTFYKSFLESAEILEELGDKENELLVYRAIAKYSLYGIEPELSGYAKAIFSNIKPTIEKANIKSAITKEENKKSFRLQKPMTLVEAGEDYQNRLIEVINARDEKHMTGEQFVSNQIEKLVKSQNHLTAYTNMNLAKATVNQSQTTQKSENTENTSSNKATEINSLEDARNYFINKPNHTYKINGFNFIKQTYEKNNETIISYTVGSGIIEEELYYQGHFLINNKSEYEKFKEWRENFLKTTKNTDIIYYRGTKFTVEENDLVIVNRLSGEFEDTFEEQKIKVFIDAYFKDKGE